MNIPSTTAPQVKLKTIALPAEHGGWGFLLEPILLGLLVAPSWAGFMLGLGMFGMFLIRHPFKMAVTDRKRGKRYARTALAERFVIIYAAASLLSFACAVLIAADGAILVPLVLALPFMLIQLFFDLTNRSRSVIPELVGPAALAAVGTSIAIAGGWTLTAALPLWGVIVARAIPSVLYVRARLRLEHEKPTSPIPVIITHLLGIVGVMFLALFRAVPWLPVAALVVLLIRAALGLSERRESVPPKIIGFREMAYGLLVVIATAVGYRLMF